MRAAAGGSSYDVTAAMRSPHRHARGDLGARDDGTPGPDERRGPRGRVAAARAAGHVASPAVSSADREGTCAVAGRIARAGHRQPGVAARGVVALDLRLDQAVGPVRGDEHLAVVGQPVHLEATEVHQEVVLVGRREPDLGDLLLAVEHRAPHRVQRLLQRSRVGAGEGLEQGLQHRGVRRVPVDAVDGGVATSPRATWPGPGRRPPAAS